LVIGGTSFAGFSAAVKLIVLGGAVFEGDDGLLLPHEIASNPAAARMAYRFIVL
jgi:hypothetical protein